MRECWLWAVGMTECFEERNAPACSCTPCNIGNAQHTHAHALAAHPHPRDVSAHACHCCAHVRMWRAQHWPCTVRCVRASSPQFAPL
jgi:hypothetical protein